MQEIDKFGLDELERLKESGALILYMPVIHKGYLDLLQKYDGSVKALYLVGGDLAVSLGVPKEIRAIDTKTMQKLIVGFGFSFDVEVLDFDRVGILAPQVLVIAGDTVSRAVRERYFSKVPFIQETVFLRWDEDTVKSPKPAHFDRETSGEFHVQMIQRARQLADSSSDWWRQVGVVVVRDGVVLVEEYNRYLPSEHTPYIEGNPRDFIKAGTLGFLSESVHAEQAAIAQAANRGISLQGADLYLNSYPCPTCAIDMALAGIKRCFFSGGNAYLNVEEVFQAMDMEAIFVRE